MQEKGYKIDNKMEKIRENLASTLSELGDYYLAIKKYTLAEEISNSLVANKSWSTALGGDYTIPTRKLKEIATNIKGSHSETAKVENQTALDEAKLMNSYLNPAADILIPDSVTQAVHHNKPPPLLSSLNNKSNKPAPPPPLPKRPSGLAF